MGFIDGFINGLTGREADGSERLAPSNDPQVWQQRNVVALQKYTDAFYGLLLQALAEAHDIVQFSHRLQMDGVNTRYSNGLSHLNRTTDLARYIQALDARLDNANKAVVDELLSAPKYLRELLGTLKKEPYEDRTPKQRQRRFSLRFPKPTMRVQAGAPTWLPADPRERGEAPKPPAREVSLSESRAAQDGLRYMAQFEALFSEAVDDANCLLEEACDLSAETLKERHAQVRAKLDACRDLFPQMDRVNRILDNTLDAEIRTFMKAVNTAHHQMREFCEQALQAKQAG